MIGPDFAQRFAADWIGAWNRHDLDAVLALCADELELSMPRLPAPAGRLRGKTKVAAWWARALTAPSLTVAPRVHLAAAAALPGTDSLVLLLRGTRPSAQVFRFRPDGRVTAIAVHTQPADDTETLCGRALVSLMALLPPGA